MKRILLTAFCLSAMALETTLTAADVKARKTYLENYNVQRALEVMDENPREAYDFLDKETDEHPNNGYAWYLMAALFQGVENYGTVITYATDAIRYLETSQLDVEWASKAYLLRASAYEVLGHDDLQLKDLNQAVKNKKLISIGEKVDNSEAYEARAQYYYEKKQYALSDADYQKMIEKDPHNILPFIGLGRNANAQGRYEEALTHFKKAYEIDPDYGFYHLFVSEPYFHLGQYDEAVDEVVQAIMMDETAMTALGFAADSLANVAYDKLIERLEQERKKQPDNLSPIFAQGLVSRTSAHDEEALNYYLEAGEMTGIASLYMYVCSAADACGKYEEAVQYGRKCYEMDSTNFDVCSCIASAYISLGQYAEAKQWCELAIEELPDEAAGYYELSRVYNHQGLPADAAKYLEICYLLSPESSHYVSSYAYVLDLLGRKEEMKKVAEQGLLTDTLVTRYTTRCLLLALLDRRAEAEEWLDQCMEKIPQYNSDWLVDKSMSYLILGDIEAARKALAEAVAAGYKHIEPLKRSPYFRDHLDIFDNL